MKYLSKQFADDKRLSGRSKIPAWEEKAYANAPRVGYKSTDPQDVRSEYRSFVPRSKPDSHAMMTDALDAVDFQRAPAQEDSPLLPGVSRPASM